MCNNEMFLYAYTSMNNTQYLSLTNSTFNCELTNVKVEYVLNYCWVDFITINIKIIFISV